MESKVRYEHTPPFGDQNFSLVHGVLLVSSWWHGVRSGIRTHAFIRRTELGSGTWRTVSKFVTYPSGHNTDCCKLLLIPNTIYVRNFPLMTNLHQQKYQLSALQSSVNIYESIRGLGAHVCQWPLSFMDVVLLIKEMVSEYICALCNIYPVLRTSLKRICFHRVNEKKRSHFRMWRWKKRFMAKLLLCSTRDNFSSRVCKTTGSLIWEKWDPY